MAIPDSVAQLLMGEIDDTLNKLTALSEAVIEATRAVNESKLVTLDQHTASLKRWAEQMIQFTNEHANRLEALTNQRIDGITKAEKDAEVMVKEFANGMRTAVIKGIGSEIAGIIEERLKAIDGIVSELNPSLTGYIEGVKKLVGNLESHAIALDNAVKQASINGAAAGAAAAVKEVGESVDDKINRLHKTLFLFLGAGGLTGIVVAVVVSHWLK